MSKFEYPVSIDYNILLLENKDWNEEWEKNSFQPILIDNDCVVHSSFHQNVPEAKYDIVNQSKNGIWLWSSRNDRNDAERVVENESGK